MAHIGNIKDRYFDQKFIATYEKIFYLGNFKRFCCHYFCKLCNFIETCSRAEIAKTIFSTNSFPNKKQTFLMHIITNCTIKILKHLIQLLRAYF